MTNGRLFMRINRPSGSLRYFFETACQFNTTGSVLEASTEIVLINTLTIGRDVPELPAPGISGTAAGVDRRLEEDLGNAGLEHRT
jgi:hypothetical protein